MGALLSLVYNFICVVIPRAIIGFVVKISERLFSPKFWKTYPDGKSRGLFWKYMWWCVKISIYLAIFSIGGIGLTMMGIIYIYFKLFRKITQPTNEDKDAREEMIKQQEENEYYQQEDIDIKI
jgi:hypothetical protein